MPLAAPPPPAHNLVVMAAPPKKKRDTILSTSIGRVLHTQQGVRNMLKSITSHRSHSNPALASGVQDDEVRDGGRARLAKWHHPAPAPAADQQHQVTCLHFSQPMRHRAVCVQCAVCKARVPSTECGYMFNCTVLKPWIALCKVCYLTVDNQISDT